MTAGEFPPDVRAAILGRTHDRCAGCATTQHLTIQHRRARGMGGSRDPLTAHPANGIALCGSGTTGCHGWTEAHPLLAGLLGWRIPQGTDPREVPYWVDRLAGPYSWCRVDDDGALVYVHWDDLSLSQEAFGAVNALSRWLAVRSRR